MVDTEAVKSKKKIRAHFCTTYSNTYKMLCKISRKLNRNFEGNVEVKKLKKFLINFEIVGRVLRFIEILSEVI